MKSDNHIIESIEVTGIVQGVGFRPFVHNLAVKHGLGGYVLNGPKGVSIEIEGPSETIEAFLYDLEHSAPPLSKILNIVRNTSSVREIDENLPRHKNFEIRDSVREGKPITLIPPDVCVCDECRAELFDPENRRHLYPFINCTNCGPRFTIIRGLPYDRPYTTMSEFAMCPDCLREYQNPVDRRFHAQPNACEVCGPHLEFLDSEGNPLDGDPVAGAVAMLKAGKVVAVKGLGGFHLVADGTNDGAVKRLRERKHRDEKPLAIMTGTIDDAAKLVHAEKTETQLLESIERPIVLARKREKTITADSVAPDNNYLGIMLPYTPVHYLLFFDPASGGNYESGHAIFPALVMTSGNLSEEPICKDNSESIDRLHGIADAYLVHNRGIHVRSDDSVVRIADGEASFLRRSRGYVPTPVFLKEPMPSVLALGAELKNTICITEGRRAFSSQHIGDMENITTLDFFHEAVSHFKKILEIEPEIFAYDLHPGYLSSQYFKQIEEDFGENGDSGRSFGAAGVQHHHAHIASVLAEHGRNGPVIGLSMDGTGYGLDGAIWGGEVLLASRHNFARVAHVDYVPMPGGESAVRETWRMAFSYLSAAYGDDISALNLQCLNQVSADELDLLGRACRSGINSPRTSSMGRFFDAAASILDIRHIAAFEGQAAIMLDMLASKEHAGTVLPYDIRESAVELFDNYPVLKGTLKNTAVPPMDVPDTGYIFDYTPLVRALAEGMANGRAQSQLAYDFHLTIMATFLEVLNRIREATGIATVALSGGCWQNRILSDRMPEMLRAQGYEVLTNRLVPPNDGGLSLGQAYIAGGCTPG
jgi:hydrogenase maturation protein HypF